MGTGRTYRCNNCNHSASTYGLSEFYRNSEGIRKPYGHPGPCSEEARNRGIYGFSAEVYCYSCDEIFDLPIVEFKEPTQKYLSAWGGNWEPKEEPSELENGCPRCGGDTMILAPPKDGKKILCPRCKKGEMKVERTWMT